MAGLVRSHVAWAAVAGIAAIVAALVGVATMVRGSDDARATRADAIREHVRTFDAGTRRVADQLSDGSALIDAAHATALSLRVQAGPHPRAADLLRVLHDKGAILTASVEGWATEPDPAGFQATVAKLTVTEEQLPGELSVLSPLAQLLQRVVRDSYSSVKFRELLVGEPLALFLRAHHADDIATMTRALARHLSSGIAGYYIARYANGVKRIKSFVTKASGDFADLNDRTLVTLAKSTPAHVQYKTFTGQAGAELTALRGRLPGVVVDDLVARLRLIEERISPRAR